MLRRVEQRASGNSCLPEKKCSRESALEPQSLCFNLVLGVVHPSWFEALGECQWNHHVKLPVWGLTAGTTGLESPMEPTVQDWERWGQDNWKYTSIHNKWQMRLAMLRYQMLLILGKQIPSLFLLLLLISGPPRFGIFELTFQDTVKHFFNILWTSKVWFHSRSWHQCHYWFLWPIQEYSSVCKLY